MEELAKEAEEAAKRGEQRNVHKVTKLICGKYDGSRNAPIRDKQEQLLTTEKDQEARWGEHFKEVLNRPAPEEEPDIPEAEEDLSFDHRKHLAATPYGTEGKSLMTGMRVSSSRYQREELSLNAATGVALHYNPLLVRS